MSRHKRRRRTRTGSLLGASAVMAAGTVVSRLTGFGRAAVIAAAIGFGITAETFNIPNTIPNTLYILVAGGVLNSVLVPQLVRAMRNDEDQGEAYAQRLYSVVVVVLLVASVLAVLLAPWLVQLFVSAEYTSNPDLRPFFDSMVWFARFCLPQIFFYGLYVVLGQMLNARGRFGPYMWAPVANNLVAIAVFGAFLVVVGPITREPLTVEQVAWLGLGSTAGIALQALVLYPVLRASGLRLRLRRDVRGVGLGKAGRLGLWTVAFVLVNQLAFVVVVKVASGGAVASLDPERGGAYGYSVYANAFLLVMVPHAVITVSLATALLPGMSRLAADGDLETLRVRLVGALRACLAVMVPVAGLLAVLAIPVAGTIFGFGGAAQDSGQVALVVIAFAPGLVAFTAHYLALRGFYALEDTRTPFFVQIAVAVTLAANAVVVRYVYDVRYTAAGLGLGWSIAYVVGAGTSLAVLGHRIGRLGQWRLLAHVARLVLASLPAVAVAAGVVLALGRALEGGDVLRSAVQAAAGGLAAVLTFFLTTRVVRVREVDDAVTAVARRVRPDRSSGGGPPTMGPSGGQRPGDDTGGDPAARATTGGS